jgi:hypothetical protein
LRNKILYISTENLNFFYRLNKELSRLNIKFEILNIKDKLPTIPSLILTTREELDRFKGSYKNLNFLSYYYKENFQHYILRVLAAYRIEYKDFYSELLFSIDPGSKRIGIVIFLDDLFFISRTIYDKTKFIDFIYNIVTCFQKNNPILINLKFKFGNGVLLLSIELLRKVFDVFDGRENMKVYLIDESKSSKSKFKDKFKRIRTKHEVSALILSLRKGIEVNESNYYKVIKPNKITDLNHVNIKNNKNEQVSNHTSTLKLIIKKLLNNEISLSKSYEIFQKNAIY